jgi:two-component system response regulator ChvI
VRTYTASALQGLTARPVDLAVLDIKMPRMDGMELLQRPASAVLCRIFLTRRTRRLSLRDPPRADDYITKPFSQRLLIETHPRPTGPHDVGRAEGSVRSRRGDGARSDVGRDQAPVCLAR